MAESTELEEEVNTDDEADALELMKLDNDAVDDATEVLDEID